MILGVPSMYDYSLLTNGSLSFGVLRVTLWQILLPPFIIIILFDC